MTASPQSLETEPLQKKGGDLSVALVCMPFYLAMRPSIQIGLLHAIVEKAGFAVDSHHLNLHLAARVPLHVYDAICSHRGHLTGEWLFSVAAFGEEECQSDEAFFSMFPSELEWIQKLGRDGAFLSELRHQVLPQYVDDCASLVDWTAYDVVGFTSTFQQNAASLALARRIKEKQPGIRIVFGGANMEDEMGPELVRAFPCIDYAVVGEGDVSFPGLLRCIAAGRSPKGIPGIVIRAADGVESFGQSVPLRDMNSLPVPQYEEYFKRAQRLGICSDPEYTWAIPFESSRGCWWGEKHHCTFCGLNGLGMVFRAKSPGRVLDELSELARKHRISFFEATDNIMDLKYVSEFFSQVQERKTDYTFFYEVKSNLTRDQIGTLYRGGVRWIQPGIESLSTHVLQLMRKGCTMLQNVLTLKWCRYYRIRVSWNLLWGFPGETETDFVDELRVLRLLSHLEPPGGAGRIWVERFSPYYAEPGAFPVTDLRPEASYHHVYPRHVALEKIAYFFDYSMGDTIADEGHSPTREWIGIWRKRWVSDRPDTLTYRRTIDSLFIDDNRGSERCGSYAFYGPLASMYEFCGDAPRTAAGVQRRLAEMPGEHFYPESQVKDALEEFCRQGLMLSENGRYLGLAIPVNPNW